MKSLFAGLSAFLVGTFALCATGCATEYTSVATTTTYAGTTLPAASRVALVMEFRGGEPTPQEREDVRTLLANYLASRGSTLVEDPAAADYLVHAVLERRNPDNPAEWTVIETSSARSLAAAGGDEFEWPGGIIEDEEYEVSSYSYVGFGMFYPIWFDVWDGPWHHGHVILFPPFHRRERIWDHTWHREHRWHRPHRWHGDRRGDGKRDDWRRPDRDRPRDDRGKDHDRDRWRDNRDRDKDRDRWHDGDKRRDENRDRNRRPGDARRDGRPGGDQWRRDGDRTHGGAGPHGPAGVRPGGDRRPPSPPATPPPAEMRPPASQPPVHSSPTRPVVRSDHPRPFRVAPPTGGPREVRTPPPAPPAAPRAQAPRPERPPPAAVQENNRAAPRSLTPRQANAVRQAERRTGGSNSDSGNSRGNRSRDDRNGDSDGERDRGRH